MATSPPLPARALHRLVDAWLATCSSDNTRDAYRRDVRRFVAWCDDTGRDPIAVTGPDVDRYRDHCLAGGARAATVGRRLSAMTSFYRYLASVGAVAANPVREVDRPPAEPPTREGLDDGEVHALLAAAAGAGAKATALVGLLVLDGMRLHEALALDVDDVALTPRTATVTVPRRGGPQAIRLQPLSARAVAQQVGDRRSGPLFVGDRAVDDPPTRLTRFGAHYLIRRTARSAGIDRPVSATSLRRSYADAAHRAGTGIPAIAARVGHQHPRETRRMLDTTRVPAL